MSGDKYNNEIDNNKINETWNSIKEVQKKNQN